MYQVKNDPGSSECSYLRLVGTYGHEGILSTLADRGYKLGKTIGEGSYCRVKLAYRATELGFTQKVACKIINKKNASKDFVMKFLPRELSIIKNIRHPHIVTVFQIIDIDDHVYIFMDLCDRGDLLDYIRNRGSLSEPRARLFFRQLVYAVEYLHGRDIAHRDLKCENILLANKDCVKIADFGFARWCREQYSQRRVLSDTFCGSAAYAAPEILQGVRYNPKMYDVWSLGCVLYIMLCATMPFDDSNIKQMLKIQLTKRISFPSKSTLSTRAKKLILHILEPDVTKRATIKQIANCSWLLDRCLEFQETRQHQLQSPQAQSQNQSNITSTTARPHVAPQGINTPSTPPTFRPTTTTDSARRRK